LNQLDIGQNYLELRFPQKFKQFDDENKHFLGYHQDTRLGSDSISLVQFRYSDASDKLSVVL
jgi:hypothetical protein